MHPPLVRLILLLIQFCIVDMNDPAPASALLDSGPSFCCPPELMAPFFSPLHHFCALALVVLCCPRNSEVVASVVLCLQLTAEADADAFGLYRFWTRRCIAYSEYTLDHHGTRTLVTRSRSNLERRTLQLYYAPYTTLMMLCVSLIRVPQFF